MNQAKLVGLRPSLRILCFVLSCCGQPLWGQELERFSAAVSPAATTVLELPRNTAAQQLRAILTLVDLGEDELAAQLWKKWPRQNITPAARVALVEEFGTARFLKLSRLPAERFPEAREFAADCQQAAVQQAQDPTRLAKLIQDLADDSLAVRLAARGQLSASGTAGAAACLTALAAAPPAALRTELLVALASIRPAADPLLLAVLAEGSGQVRLDTLQLVGQLKFLEAVPWLGTLAAGTAADDATTRGALAALAHMGLSAPSAEEAVQVVRQALQRAETAGLAGDTPRTWWSLDTSAGQPTARTVTPAEYQRLQLARLSRLLLHIPAASPADRQGALIYAYQAAPVLGEPLPAEITQSLAALRPDSLSAALAQALARDAEPAATGLIRLLAEQADPSTALASVPGTGQAAPLAQALRHKNPHIRYAALAAVMQLAPPETFAGASGVPATLWYFVARGGKPAAPAEPAADGESAELVQARQALVWLAELLEQGHPYDELIRDSGALAQTVYREALVEPSLQVLARLDTPAAQRLLLDLASRHTLPLATRRQAVEAFATSIGRAGKLLRSQELLQQYDRYNASATASPETQALLGQILDILEAPHNSP